MVRAHGFAPILIILAAITILAVSVIGLKFYLRSHIKLDDTILPISQNYTPSPQASPTPSDETANWKIYEDQALGVSISYPSAWKVTRYGTDYFKGGTPLLDPESGVMLYGKDSLLIYRHSNPNDLNLKDYISAQKREVENETKVHGPGLYPQTFVMGANAKLPNGLNVNKARTDCEPNFCTSYYIQRPKYFYEISFKEQSDMDIINKILSTFKFTN